MFCHFWQKFKMAVIFGEGKIFGKLPRIQCSDTLWVEKFDEIALSRTVKEIEATLCFAIFWQKFEKSKWPPFLGRGKFFENCRVHSLDTLWVENFNKIALSRTVKEIDANLCFATKIQNGHHFWGGEHFLKIAKIIFLRYPVGRKFRRNRSISHG